MSTLTNEQLITVLREHLAAANNLLESEGWYPFCYHADKLASHLDFSNQTDADGDPYYERVHKPELTIQALAAKLFELCDPRAHGLEFLNKPPSGSPDQRRAGEAQLEEYDAWLRRAQYLRNWRAQYLRNWIEDHS